MGLNEESESTPAQQPNANAAKWIEEKLADISTNEENSTDSEKIWYFAYGSNMNSRILGGRRNVHPTLSKPASVPGWYLNFDVVMPASSPYSGKEPSFASIGKKPLSESQPELHGVAHQITRKEYEQIVKTEGKAYASVEIVSQTYDGDQLTALTLVYPPRDSEKPIYPSERYMKLLEGGSIEFGLDPSYQEWLKSLPRFVVPQTPSPTENVA